MKSFRFRLLEMKGNQTVECEAMPWGLKRDRLAFWGAECSFQISVCESVMPFLVNLPYLCWWNDHVFDDFLKGLSLGSYWWWYTPHQMLSLLGWIQATGSVTLPNHRHSCQSPFSLFTTCSESFTIHVQASSSCAPHCFQTKPADKNWPQTTV